MKRAAIYTRYSSDLQNDRSIEDQAVLCRAFAIKASLQVVCNYEDRAMSGSSVHGRGGLLQMMADARAGKFDVLLVESLDRVSRDQEDLPAIYKRLTFLGIDMVAVHDGKADQMQVGIRSIVGAMYLTDLAQKTRRGLQGVVRDGRTAGGHAYGYTPIPGKPGVWSVNEDEAQVIKRIFALYLAGQRPRDIAMKLNAERVKPPRGPSWAQSTINGNSKRACGILQNAAYVGRFTWNRVRMIKDPDTGKRVSRINPQSEWMHAEIKTLRIIDDETWAHAQALRAARRHILPAHQRKPRELFSGLLKCHACGGGLSIKQRVKGRAIAVCTRHKEAKSCRNQASYYLDVVERVVLATLVEKLRDQTAINYYVKVYNAQRRELVGRAAAERTRLEMRLGAIEREYQRTRDGYIKGFITEAETQETLPSLRAERDRVKAELAAAAAPPKVVALHPKAIEGYLVAVLHLEAAIKAGAADGSEASREAVRALVHSIVVRKAAPKGGHDLEIVGRLAHLIDHTMPGRHHSPGSIRLAGGSMVAGASLADSPLFRIRVA